MQKTSLWLCLWPGLARLWLAGRWSGLLAAGAFAAIVNFALGASLAWPGNWSPSWVAMLWVVAGVWWLASITTALRQRNRGQLPARASADVDLFIQAQTEYLKGSWFEAETRLRELLARNDLDVDAQIMLTGLYRHTGRFAEAHQCLRRLERTSGAEKWRLEIEEERVRLERKTAIAAEPAAAVSDAA